MLPQKIAAFDMSSIGKTCQNQSRRPPTKLSRSDRHLLSKQENHPLSEQISRCPVKFKFIPLLRIIGLKSLKFFNEIHIRD